jgi:outer membrane protein assembly factor BamB
VTGRRLLVGAIAGGLVLVLLAAAGFWYFTRETPVEFAALESAGVTVPYGTDGSISAAASYTAGDVNYVAWTFDEKVKLAAVEPGSKKKLWEVDAPGGAKGWDQMFAGPDGIVLYPTQVSSSVSESMYVFDPANGKLRWERQVKPNEVLRFYAAAIVIEAGDDDKVYAVDWAGGKQKWSLGDRLTSSGSARSTDTFTVRPADTQSNPSPITGELSVIDGGDSNRLLQFDDEPMMRVIDVATGKAREKAGVKAGDSTPVLAFGDKLYLVVADNGYQVREYDLAKLGEPRVVLTNTDDQRKIIARPARCGESRICMIEATGSDAKSTQVVAVDAKDGKLAWKKPAPEAKELIELGDGVAVSTDSSPPGGLVFDGSGKQLLSDDAKKNYPARVDGSSVLLFSAPPSDYPADAALTGVSLDGKRTPLGSLQDIVVGGCSWSREFLACPAKGEFRFWRFAS